MVTLFLKQTTCILLNITPKSCGQHLLALAFLLLAKKNSDDIVKLKTLLTAKLIHHLACKVTSQSPNKSFCLTEMIAQVYVCFSVTAQAAFEFLH